MLAQTCQGTARHFDPGCPSGPPPGEQATGNANATGMLAEQQPEDVAGGPYDVIAKELKALIAEAGALRAACVAGP